MFTRSAAMAATDSFAQNLAEIRADLLSALRCRVGDHQSDLSEYGIVVRAESLARSKRASVRDLPDTLRALKSVDHLLGEVRAAAKRDDGHHVDDGFDRFLRDSAWALCAANLQVLDSEEVLIDLIDVMARSISRDSETIRQRADYLVRDAARKLEHIGIRATTHG